MSTPGIYKKLHSIMSECNYIQKDKKNDHFKYSYASEAAIKDALHGLFVKHGVIPCFSTAEHEVNEYKRNDKGQAQYRTTLALAYRFIDIEDGSEMAGVVHGSGVDGEDKGTYKALTGALKYCLTSTFVIPTGDDPEHENGDKPQRTAKPKVQSTTIGAAPHPQDSTDSYITDPQRKRFYAIYNKNGWTDEQVKELLAKKGIYSGKHIPKGPTYESLCEIVEKQTYAEYVDYTSNPPAA